MFDKSSPTDTFLDRLDKTLAGSTKWLFVLFGGAFVLKLIYILQSADSTQVTALILDAKYYDRTAREIAGGQVVRPDAFFMGPLYSYFLAVVYGILGRHILIIRLLQILAGSLTVVVTCLVGARVFRPSVGLLGAVLLLLYGAVTFYEGQILMMWLGTVLNMLMLLVLLRGGDKGETKQFGLAGLLLGLSALARANVLIFFPVLVVWVFISQTAKKKAALLALTIATVITILPATVHNYIAARDVVPITSNGGLNFYIGNSESATGVFYQPPEVDFMTDTTSRITIERLLGRDMKASEVSRYWFGQAFDFIREQPLAELKLLLRKTALFFNGYEVPQIESYDLSKKKFGSLRFLFVNFWLLVSLGMVGMLYALRRWRTCFLLYGFLISYSFSIILFFVTARYRVQIAPVLCLFSAFAVIEVFPASFRSLRLAFPAAALFGLLLLVTQPAIFALPEQDVIWREHIHQARRLSEAGRLEAALEEINQAVAIHPQRPGSYLHRAIIYKNGGRIFQAIENYEKALKLSPSLAGVHYDLAQSFRQLRLYDAAIEEYKLTVQLDPVMAEAYNNMGITYRYMKRFDDAIGCFQKALEIDPHYIKALNNLGASQAETGRLERAIETFKRIIVINPEYPNVYKNLAGVYLQFQKPAEAVLYLEQYLAMNPDDQRAADTLNRLRRTVPADSTSRRLD